LLLIAPSTIIYTAFANQGTAQNLTSQKETSFFKDTLGRSYNYSELIVWENAHLNFTYGQIDRNNDPIKIYQYGQGRCDEFATLYAELCISQGYQCRIVTLVFNDHVFNEVLLNGTWTRVDASLNDTSSRAIGYQMFFEKESGWNPPIIALAFENSSIVDVTSTYRSDGWNLLSGINLIFLLIGVGFASAIFAIWKRLSKVHCLMDSIGPTKQNT
jgi:hypothetical protein